MGDVGYKSTDTFEFSQEPIGSGSKVIGCYSEVFYGPAVFHRLLF
jgi:hypothetical protein